MRKLFVLLLIIVWGNACAQERLNITSVDIDSFWKAFESFENDTTKNPFGEYLRKGSPGLHELQRYRVKDSVAFRKSIQRNMHYYTQFRDTKFNYDSLEVKAWEYFQSFKTIFPEASVPHIYFVIGQLNTHMTTINDTVIVCIENFPDSTLTTSKGNRSSILTELPAMLATSFAVTNQRMAHTGFTLLRQSILHGGTEFISTLYIESAKSRLLEGEHFRYGEAHEEQLVREFLQMKDSNEFKDWLYEAPDDKNRPANLGIWIGYKIVEAYYNNAPNKLKAIDDIMKINDFDKFLLLSGYTESFRY